VEADGGDARSRTGRGGTRTGHGAVGLVRAKATQTTEGKRTEAASAGEVRLSLTSRAGSDHEWHGERTRTRKRPGDANEKPPVSRRLPESFASPSLAGVRVRVTPRSLHPSRDVRLKLTYDGQPPQQPPLSAAKPHERRSPQRPHASRSSPRQPSRHQQRRHKQEPNARSLGTVDVTPGRG